MCDYPNRETAMTPLRWDDNGKLTVWCDPCLAPLIEALNAGGIPTTASCCGHNGNGSDGQQQNAPGWVMLRDGRVLLILADQGAAERIARAPRRPATPGPVDWDSPAWGGGTHEAAWAPDGTHDDITEEE